MREEMLVICAAQMQHMQQKLAPLDFGDVDRNNLRDQLCGMAKVLHSRTLKGLNAKQKDDTKNFYEDLTRWMHFLLTSKATYVPEEMRFVLDTILSVWLGPGLSKLTLVYVEGDFSVVQGNKNPLGITVFEDVTGIAFTKEPVFIRIPHFYQEDMLFNIALFHEIGHVVDAQLNIFYDVKESVKKTIKSGAGYDCSKTLMRLYFPVLYKSGRLDERILVSYIKEYIADLFAAQYVGPYIIEYLDYIGAQTKIDDSKTHPHFDQRKLVVMDFLNCMNTKTHSTSNFLLKFIMDSFSGAGRGELIIRWKNIPGDDLLKGNTVPISNVDDMISIFKHTWDVIYMGVNAIENARKIPLNTMSHFDFYDSFNKRVMESIATFRVNNP